MSPHQAIRFFGQALVLGAGLGILYGFLRPLGRHHQTLADGLFCLGCWTAWVYGAFGLWDGDLGLWLLLGFSLGGFGWELGPGRFLSPVFDGFWGIIWKLLGIPRGLTKKFWHFSKFLLFKWRKMGYNRGKKNPSCPKPGGTHHETQRKTKAGPGAKL